MTHSTSPQALLIIDMQRGMAEARAGRRKNPQAEDNIALLLAAWRQTGQPVVHVRHLSRSPTSAFWPGQSGAEFQPRFEPLATEHVLEKNVTDATFTFDMQDISGALRPAEDVHMMSLSNLRGEYAAVTSTSELLP
jgi:nicotinamidase-related amidase